MSSEDASHADRPVGDDDAPQSAEGDAISQAAAPPRGGRVDGKLGCFLTFLVGLACLGLAWFLLYRKTGTQLDATTELAQVVAAAENADGTKALRDSGCAHAAVLPTETLRNIGQRLENERAVKEKREPKDVHLGTQRAVIACAAPKSPPSCKAVAVTYNAAVKNAALPFVTVVEGPNGLVCTEEFTGDPEAMKAVGPLLLPAIFPASDP